MPYDLEDVTTYAWLQLEEARKLGPKYVEALRVQRQVQVNDRIAKWESAR